MCEYCNKDSELYKDECNSHSVILKMENFPNNKIKLGIDLYCGSEGTSFLDYIDINYCPMCGRKINQNIYADEMLKNLNFIKDIGEDFEIVQKQEEIDIDSIEKLEGIVEYSTERNTINQLIQAVKQLNKKVKEMHEKKIIAMI